MVELDFVQNVVPAKSITLQRTIAIQQCEVTKENRFCILKIISFIHFPSVPFHSKYFSQLLSFLVSTCFCGYKVEWLDIVLQLRHIGSFWLHFKQATCTLQVVQWMTNDDSDVE